MFCGAKAARNKVAGPRYVYTLHHHILCLSHGRVKKAIIVIRHATAEKEGKKQKKF
jgi:hypothetical protein